MYNDFENIECNYLSIKVSFKEDPSLNDIALLALKNFSQDSCNIEKENDSNHALESLNKIKNFPISNQDIVICYCTKFHVEGKTVSFNNWFTRYLEIASQNGSELSGELECFDHGEMEVIRF